jgi:diguanylate cyclase (GGDEF)-like protein
MWMTGGEPAIKRKFRGLGGSIAAKLYCFAFLSLLAVGSLSIASIYFSRATESAAHSLYSDSFIGVLNSTRLELLLANHRRIVESMPPEVDRDRLYADQLDLEEIKSRFQTLMKEIGERQPADKHKRSEAVSLEQRIGDSLPALFEAANQVYFYANEFAQDKAVEQANDYAHVANGVELLIKQHRNLRMREAQQAVDFVSATAKSLMAWVLLSAFVAIVLIGPIGLTTMHRALFRLRRITQAMIKLARNDTTVQIPSHQDRDEVGEMARAVEVFKDNAIQLIAREVELKQLNRRVDIALNNMTHGLCMFDAEHNLIVCNKTYVQMYALTPELAQPGTPLRVIDQYRAAIGNGALANPEQVAAESAIATREASAFTQELMDGRIVAVSQRPMQDGGWVAVHEDITERRRAEAKIAHLARHDMLTNLPNRVLFREQLETEFGRIQPSRGFAVHCLDLDHFKTVNDTLGHPIGDELLKLVAARLIEAVPPTDFIARIGGDEFAVVQTGVAKPEQCSLLASRIVERVSEPYDIQGRHIVIGTSIGIAIAPGDGTNPDVLLKNADMALYLAKGEGRGTHRFFEGEMDKRLQARHALELDLRKAIASGEFELYYQPIIDLQSGKVTCFEALLRWNHPERGMISPLEFIPLAEETGLILPLGEWVLRTACQQASKWPKQIGVAVNLSATQFKGRNIVQIAVNALAMSGLAADRLDLEITESVLLQDEANTLAILHQLREIGVQISMDDFGTGYSSLAYLRNFPFDRLKIDRSFVRDMLVRKDCRAIVRAVAGLARSLGITTIIEGIETKEQLETAQADGCDLGQGYIFSKPMPEREIAAFLAKRERTAAAA